MTLWEGPDQPVSLFAPVGGQDFLSRTAVPGDPLWTHDEERAFLERSEAEETWNSGILVTVYHLQNPDDTDFFGDVPKKLRDYSTPAFKTRAFIRYGLTEYELRRFGLDIEKNNGVVIFSKLLLQELGAEVILGDLISYGDGKRFVVQELKDPDESRRLHEPEVLRIWAGIHEFRQTTGQKVAT